MAHPSKRNVLFIVADQWRGDCLGCVGNPLLRTVNLDALAADGTTFTRHFVQASPCGPSRASMYTGLYMFNHRSVNNGTPLDARHTTLAVEARSAGYDPTLFGYTSTSVDPRTVEPGDPRLEDYEGMLPGFSDGAHGKWSPWLNYLRERGYPEPITPAVATCQRVGYPGASSRGRTYAPAIYSAADSETAFLTDRVLDWLRQRNEKGWFVHMSIKKPHPPWVAPEPYNAMYDPDRMPVPVRPKTPHDAASQHSYLAWMIENHRRPNYLAAPTSREADVEIRDILQARAVYYGLMTEVDHHVGRILKFLRESGQYDDTLVVFTSDHGEYLGDHYLMGKYGYFDQAFHVPLIIRDPDDAANAQRGRRVGAFSEAVDLMPTILDWIGCKVPRQCDGESLLPLVREGKAAGWRTEAHWEFDFRDIRDLGAAHALGLAPDQCNLAVIRGNRFKYVHFAGLPSLFFDLENDPGEAHNLAGNPVYRDAEIEYAQKMLSWRMTHADRTLANMQVGDGGLFEWSGTRRSLS